jgi:5-methylcytosine-specific restriction endonuclease McrA
MFDYYGTKWKEKRKKILRRDKYRCQVYAMYGRNVEANTVHHIYSTREYPEYAWCDWNLISVSLEGHNKLENRKTGELTDLGKALRERTIPPV